MDNGYLDLKYELVCIIAKETIKDLKDNDFLKEHFKNGDFDFSGVECELSEKIDKIIEQIKML